MTKTTCLGCETYKELSDIYGYCIEWDTIVFMDDMCIATKELELLNKKDDVSDTKYEKTKA